MIVARSNLHWTNWRAFGKREKTREAINLSVCRVPTIGSSPERRFTLGSSAIQESIWFRSWRPARRKHASKRASTRETSIGWSLTDSCPHSFEQAQASVFAWERRIINVADTHT